MTEQFIIYTREKVHRLRRGMTMRDVKVLLGDPDQTQQCESKANTKYLYKFPNGSAFTNYTVLFNSGQVVYVAKIN